MDQGEIGLIESIHSLRKMNLLGIGSHFLEEPALNIVEKKGIRIGFLGFTEHTNGLALPKQSKLWVLNTKNTETVKQALSLIQESKKKVDFLVVSYHFGEEYQSHREDYKKTIAHKMLESGADFILGHHPHVLQEVELYKVSRIKQKSNAKNPKENTKNTKNARTRRENTIRGVAYSLGNFVSGQVPFILSYAQKDSKRALRSEGVLLDLEIAQNKKRVFLRSIALEPTWNQTHTWVNSKGKTSYGYQVLNIKKELEKDIPKDFQRLLKYRYQKILSRVRPKWFGKPIGNSSNPQAKAVPTSVQEK